MFGQKARSDPLIEKTMEIRGDSKGRVAYDSQEALGKMCARAFCEKHNVYSRGTFSRFTGFSVPKFGRGIEQEKHRYTVRVYADTRSPSDFSIEIARGRTIFMVMLFEIIVSEDYLQQFLAA